MSKSFVNVVAGIGDSVRPSSPTLSFFPQEAMEMPSAAIIRRARPRERIFLKKYVIHPPEQNYDLHLPATIIIACPVKK
jgi:hypothetical protein